MNTTTELQVPALLLKGSVLFPYLTMPIVVNKLFLKTAEEALNSEDKLIAVFSQINSSEHPAQADIFHIGTLGVIKRMGRAGDVMHLQVQGVQRVELLKVEQEKPFLKILVKPIPEPEQELDMETEATYRGILELTRSLAELVQPSIQIDLEYTLGTVAQKPLHQIYFIASLLTLDLSKELALLEMDHAKDIFLMLYDFLNHEVQVLRLREKIASQAQNEIGKQQREYVLRQQLRAIQEELGEQTTEQSDIADLRLQMQSSKLPEQAQLETEKELKQLERLSASSPEYQVIRSHIELILDLPWNTFTVDSLDLQNARAVLDADHFGLKDVKSRIVEHLAVMKLNPDASAPILCFVGPPGVGKTSVGQSIARAMGRKFERMSLGGLHDEAELRGHRRTYIGAMPGRIMRALRRTQVKNPLLMLDEVDKLGMDFRGDPAAALMEVLDPEQNNQFHDNYLDVPFDLSNVFFITTANSLDPIPKPLLDRMEVIPLLGYSDYEKLQIAKRYLIPRQLKESGLVGQQFVLQDDALLELIHLYTRESGVRNLQRRIAQLARKIAVDVADGKANTPGLSIEEIKKLLGPEPYQGDLRRDELLPGVAAGLAWTEVGGELLYIETADLRQSGDMVLTGQLGNIMQESAKIAQSFAQSKMTELAISYEQGSVHIHLPAGAIPKDGPSAGITILVALMSLYSQIPVKRDIAMTGELTLSGLVLPVGGIKEKVLAAHRNKIKEIILPEGNRSDIEQIEEHIRKDIEFDYVTEASEVLNLALPELMAKHSSVINLLAS